MKKVLSLLVLALTASVCFAQEELPELVPDRPGMTWGAEVTPHQKVIWDHGFGFEKTPDNAKTLTLSSAVVRYGLFENVELRVGTDFLMYGDADALAPSIGIAPLFVGTKIKLYESDGILPSVGMLAELRSPHVGSKDLLPSYLAPSMYLLFEHELGDRFWLAYNAGLEWDGETAEPTTRLSLALGCNITDNFGVFLDSYNYLVRDDENQYMAELGFTWLVSRRVQLDIEGDFDLMNLGRYYAAGLGVSWLIN